MFLLCLFFLFCVTDWICFCIRRCSSWCCWSRCSSLSTAQATKHDRPGTTCEQPGPTVAAGDLVLCGWTSLFSVWLNKPYNMLKKCNNMMNKFVNLYNLMKTHVNYNIGWVEQLVFIQIANALHSQCCTDLILSFAFLLPKLCMAAKP